MTIIETAERMLPLGLRIRLAPLLRKLQPMLTGTDETARAQRMALTAFVIRIFSAGIAFLSQIIQARLMGEFEYGIFAFVWVLVIVFGNLSCLGFHTVVIRFLPHYRERDETAELRGLNWTARVCDAVCQHSRYHRLCCSPFCGRDARSLLVSSGLPRLFTLPMIALGDVLDGTARANGWTVTALSPTYIIRPLLILILMVLAVAAGEPRSAVTAMTSALAATYLTTLFQFIRLTIRLRRVVGRGNLRFEFMPWLRFAFPFSWSMALASC